MDPRFLGGGGKHSKGWRQMLLFGLFTQKLHKFERNRTERVVCLPGVPLDPPKVIELFLKLLFGKTDRSVAFVFVQKEL